MNFKNYREIFNLRCWYAFSFSFILNSKKHRKSFLIKLSVLTTLMLFFHKRFQQHWELVHYLIFTFLQNQDIISKGPCQNRCSSSNRQINFIGVRIHSLNRNQQSKTWNIAKAVGEQKWRDLGNQLSPLKMLSCKNRMG